MRHPYALRFLPRLSTSLARLPLPALHRIGSTLGQLQYYLRSRNRRVAEANIHYLGERAPIDDIRRILRANGKMTTEVAAFWNWPAERLMPLIRQVHGQTYFDEALQAGGGLIIAVPHLGAWELMNVWLCQQTPITTMYRPPRQAVLEPYLRQIRSRFGMQLAPSDSRGIRQLLGQLRRGGVVALLPDQEPSREHGIFAPFYGRPACSMTLLSRLANKSNSPVLFGAAIRQSDDRSYHLHFQPAPAAFYSDDLQQSVGAMNQAMEQLIALAPEQYNWIYRRFRQTPEGPSRLYQ